METITFNSRAASWQEQISKETGQRQFVRYAREQQDQLHCRQGSGSWAPLVTLWVAWQCPHSCRKQSVVYPCVKSRAGPLMSNRVSHSPVIAGYGHEDEAVIRSSQKVKSEGKDQQDTWESTTAQLWQGPREGPAYKCSQASKQRENDRDQQSFSQLTLQDFLITSWTHNSYALSWLLQHPYISPLTAFIFVAINNLICEVLNIDWV